MRTYWLCWFIVTFPVAFLIPESVALASGHPQNTLSAAVWSLEAFTPGHAPTISHWTAFHLLFISTLITLFVWLIGHFGWGWWR